MWDPRVPVSSLASSNRTSGPGWVAPSQRVVSEHPVIRLHPIAWLELLWNFNPPVNGPPLSTHDRAGSIVFAKPYEELGHGKDLRGELSQNDIFVGRMSSMGGVANAECHHRFAQYLGSNPHGRGAAGN